MNYVWPDPALALDRQLGSTDGRLSGCWAREPVLSAAGLALEALDGADFTGQFDRADGAKAWNWDNPTGDGGGGRLWTNRG